MKVKSLILALVTFWLVPAAFAQDSDEVIRVDTDLAAFEVVVSDKEGNPVRNLKREDFRVFEDGTERPVDFFESIKKTNSGRPLSVVFALDVSGSVTLPELQKIETALQNFIAHLADYNSYFAVTTFGMEVNLLQSFTNRPDKLRRSFEKLSREPEGLSTHAYDAVDHAIRLLHKKSPPRLKQQLPKRAVILITDGFPVGDIVSPKTVIERANLAETSVYAVILPSYSRLQRDTRPLLTPLEASGVIEKTGGSSFSVTEKNFEPLFKALAEEITASYVLAFYPNEANRTNGKFHEVRIRTSKEFTIKQNRTGYQMTPDSRRSQ